MPTQQPTTPAASGNTGAYVGGYNPQDPFGNLPGDPSAVYGGGKQVVFDPTTSTWVPAGTRYAAGVMPPASPPPTTAPPTAPPATTTPTPPTTTPPGNTSAPTPPPGYDAWLKNPVQNPVMADYLKRLVAYQQSQPGYNTPPPGGWNPTPVLQGWPTPGSTTQPRTTSPSTISPGTTSPSTTTPGTSPPGPGPTKGPNSDFLGALQTAIDSLGNLAPNINPNPTPSQDYSFNANTPSSNNWSSYVNMLGYN